MGVEPASSVPKVLKDAPEDDGISGYCSEVDIGGHRFSTLERWVSVGRAAAVQSGF